MNKRLPGTVFVLLFSICSIASAGTLFQDDFESGSLSPAWTVLNSNDGRCVVSTNFSPASGNWHMVLDDAVNDALYSTASATLTLNVSHRNNIVLQFKVKSLGNEPEYWPWMPYSGLPQFDGVSISTDGGGTWQLANYLGDIAETWSTSVVFLDQYVWRGYGPRPSTVLIRFSEYDNASAPLDGIAIDDVVVTAEEQQEVVVEIPDSIPEGGGPYTGYVLLGLAASNTITADLSASATNQLLLPASVDIPAGQTYASFGFSAANDNLVNLARAVTITASIPGGPIGQAQVTILDDEMPTASLHLPAQLKEGEHPETNAWLVLDRTPLVPLTINLSANPWYELNFPYQVTVPAGQTQAVFSVQAVDDNRIDGSVPVTVTAMSLGMVSVQGQTVALDNEMASFSLVLPPRVLEGTSASATLQASGVLSSNLEVTLSTTSPADLSVPVHVTFPGGYDSLSFEPSAPDNPLRDGSRTVQVTVTASGFGTNTALTTVLDNEIATYLVGGLADIVDLGMPVQLTVAAADVERHALSNFVGSVTLEAISSDGTVQPLTPTTVNISGESGWTGQVALPRGLAGPFRIRATDAAGNSGSSGPIDVMQSLNLQLGDLVWDGRRHRFYGTLSASGQDTNSNQVVIINPATGQITSRFTLAQDPGQLALTSGGEYLYVVLNANGTIARMDPDSLTVESTFAVGTSPNSGTLYAADICTVTGTPNLLVVAQRRGPYYWGFHGVAVYEDGVPRPATVAEPDGGGHVEASDAPAVFFAQGYNGIKRLALDASGITQTAANTSLLNDSGIDIRAEGGRVVSTSGILIDGGQLRRLGSFPAASAVCLNLSANRVYFFENWNSSGPGYERIAAYDPATFTSIISLSLSTRMDAPRSFIRWGTNGLAFVTDSNVVWLTSTRLVPSQAPADLAVAVNVAPNPASVSAPIVFSVSVTNAGPTKAPGGLIKACLSNAQIIQSVTANRGTHTNSGSVITLDCGEIAPGEVIGLTITTAAESAGSLSCAAFATSEAIDPNPTNNNATTTVAVGVQTTLGAVNPVRLNANNLLYDASRGVLWATLPATTEAPLSGSIVSLDPVTGLLSNSINLEADPVPACIAMSDNGRYLYVGVRGISEVCRLDLSTSPPGRLRIPLGYDIGEPSDIETGEGDGTSFIAAGSGGQAFVFDGPVRRPTGSSVSISRVEKTGTPGVFTGYAGYGYNILTRLAVTPTGLTNMLQAQMLLDGATEIKGADNLLLSSNGRLLDATTLTLKADFATVGAPCLDVTNHRAYIASSDRLYSFNTVTFLPAGSQALPATLASYSAQSCVRWGSDGFALNATDGRVYLGRWSTIPVNPDANADGMNDDWEILNFGTLQVNPAADEDHDGICNALEFLYATSPIQPSRDPLEISLISSNGQRSVRIVFPRRAGLSPLPYTYETSADLVHWSGSQNITETIIDSVVIETVPMEVVQVLMPAANPMAGFVRFRWGSN